MDSAIKVARDSVAELAKLNQQRIDGLKQEYEGTLGMLQKNESETKAALPAAQASMSAAIAMPLSDDAIAAFTQADFNLFGVKAG